MKIIDSHQHIFWHGKDDAGAVADMDAQGIDRAWLLTWEIHPDEANLHQHTAMNPSNILPGGTSRGLTLEDILTATRRFPGRFEIGFCPHPLLGDPSARLRAAASMFGARVCGEWKFRLSFDDPRCLLLFRTAGELGMPVVLHLDVPFLPTPDGGEAYDPTWYGGTIDNLERALRACPQTTFIGHAPGFWREISADAGQASQKYPDGPVVAPGAIHRLFDTHANLFADLSAGSGARALGRDPGHAKTFLTTYADRLLFGRDYYGSELPDLLATLDLDEPTRRKIFHENAERLVPPRASGGDLRPD